jgi:PBSX family phage terminase large subunit
LFGGFDLDLTLHPGQERVIDSTARFKAVVCGIQSGKTVVGSVWLCSEIWKAHEQGRYGDWLMAAPTAKIMEQSTLPKFKAFFPKDWGEWKEGKQFFILPWDNPETGERCRIYVRSTDNPDWLEGVTLLGAWLDEAGLMDYQTWVNVQGRLSRYKGPCLMTTTPYASKWIRREIYKRWQGGDKDYEFFSWRSNENPAFPAEEYERAKRSLPETIFRRRYEGQFVTMEGLVYPDFDWDKHVVKPFELPKDWLRFGGMDFGHSQPTAILCVAEDPQEHVFYVYRELYRTETLLRDIANFLNTEDMRYVLADPQGAQAIAELNRFYGRGEVKPAENRVEIGIERIGTLLKEGRLRFFSSCENTLDEIEDYHYPAPKDDKADRPDRPVKKNDHGMDALKYAFSKQVSGLYVYKSQVRTNIRDRLMRRKFAETDPWTGY